MKKGMFVVIEGGEGVGKTSVLEGLKTHFPHALFIHEPGSTQLGEDIRKLLFNQEYSKNITPKSKALLFAAARQELCDKLIRPELENNKLIISDRYMLSNMVYQGSIDKLGNSYVELINSGYIKPDLGILLDTDPKVTKHRLSKMSRKNDNYMDKNPLDIQDKIRSEFKKMANLSDNYRIVGDKETINDKINVVYNLIKNFTV